MQATMELLRPTNDPDLNEYRDYIAALSNVAGPSEVIVSKRDKHTSVVIEFLFNRSRQVVEILSNDLDPKLFGTPGVIDAARQFLVQHRDAWIDVLVEQWTSTASHPLVTALHEPFNGRFSVSLVPDAKQAEYTFNFIVADGRSFWLETPRGADASVQFGNLEIGTRMRQAFAAIRKSAEKLF